MPDKSVSQSERADIQHLARATGALNGMVLAAAFEEPPPSARRRAAEATTQ